MSIRKEAVLVCLISSCTRMVGMETGSGIVRDASVRGSILRPEPDSQRSP